MTHILWPHQEKAIALTGAEFRKPNVQAVCLVMSTGAGKTRTGGAFCSRHLAKKPDGKILWVAHREELVSQGYDDLSSWGLLSGVIQANPTREVNPYRPVQVASIQTLLARGMFPDASLVVLDEYHHYASDKWEPFGLWYRNRRIPMIGLTATPIRTDGRGLEGLMDSLVCPITMKELIAGGYLTPFELVSPSRKLQSDQIAQSPLAAWKEHAAGRKTIIFAANIKAAREYEAEFNAAGIPAKTVWGDMPAGERRQALENYASGRIQVLTNVGVLTEGFDDRPTSCVILARGVGSLSLYLQMCGRALRCALGKTDAMIIDLHGNCHVHGRPDDDREWTLEGEGIRKAKLEQPTERFCLVCKVLLPPDGGTVCELCGIARPEAIAPAIVNAKLERYAAKRRETPEQRRAYFRKLQNIAREKGYSKFQPVMKYQALYGEKPPRAWM